MELIIDLFSLIIWVIAAALSIVVILLTFHHADMMAISKKPISKIDKGSARRFLKIILWFLISIIICIIAEGLLQKGNALAYLATNTIIYAAGTIGFCWIISYSFPSTRKKKLRKRKELRNTPS